MKRRFLAVSLILAVLFLSACSEKKVEFKDLSFNYTAEQPVSGEVKMVCNELVAPLVGAAVANYAGLQKDVTVKMDTVGHDDAVNRFINKETDILITSADTTKEQDEAIVGAYGEGKAVQLRLATDGIAIIVNKDGNRMSEITREEIGRVYTAGAVSADDRFSWADIREGLSPEEVVIYGPAAGDDLAIYFAKMVLQDKGLSTAYRECADSAAVIEAVSKDPNAIGLVSLAAYLRNADTVTGLSIDFGRGATEPTLANAMGSGAIMGAYSEFTFPVYLYIGRENASEHPQIFDFVWYLFTDQGVSQFCEALQYMPLKEQEYVNQISTLSNGR